MFQEMGNVIRKAHDQGACPEVHAELVLLTDPARNGVAASGNSLAK